MFQENPDASKLLNLSAMYITEAIVLRHVHIYDNIGVCGR